MVFRRAMSAASPGSGGFGCPDGQSSRHPSNCQRPDRRAAAPRASDGPRLIRQFEPLGQVPGAILLPRPFPRLVPVIARDVHSGPSEDEIEDFHVSQVGHEAGIAEVEEMETTRSVGWLSGQEDQPADDSRVLDVEGFGLRLVVGAPAEFLVTPESEAQEQVVVVSDADAAAADPGELALEVAGAGRRHAQGAAVDR